MYVCMCACMYVCMYMCMYVICMHVGTYVWTCENLIKRKETGKTGRSTKQYFGFCVLGRHISDLALEDQQPPPPPPRRRRIKIKKYSGRKTQGDKTRRWNKNHYMISSIKDKAFYNILSSRITNLWKIT